MDIITSINNKLNIKIKYNRIISLVPSVTELLFYLGLGNNIVGITNYCKYPKKELQNITKIGGPKKLNFNEIEKLNPDLIIAVKEENLKDEILELATNHNIFIGDVYSYKSALNFIDKIGEICKIEEPAQNLISNIEQSFNKLNINKTRTCCYIIWNEPIMTVGKNTFINDMIEKAGFVNVFNNLNSYPIINELTILEKNPEYILLSSEPFKFTKKHKIKYQNKYPNSKIILVDGEMFSWYGSRMLYFAKTIVSNPLYKENIFYSQ